jgi:hypothetical protein
MSNVIVISIKSSDRLNITLCDKEKTKELATHKGYVPDSIDFIGDDDYTEITIDVETGLVIGWDKQKVLDALKYVER